MGAGVRADADPDGRTQLLGFVSIQDLPTREAIVLAPIVRAPEPIADDEESGRRLICLEQGERQAQVVDIAVVDREGDRARRQRLAPVKVRCKRLQLHEPVPEEAKEAKLSAEPMA